MINNQVRQIETLTEQFDEFKHYRKLFGDPNAIVLTTVQPVVNDLRKTELGQTLADLEGTVDAGEAIHPHSGPLRRTGALQRQRPVFQHRHDRS